MAGLMNTCPCIESVKKLVTTGKWEGESCACGEKLPLGHILIASAVALVVAAIVSALVFGPRRK